MATIEYYSTTPIVMARGDSYPIIRTVKDKKTKLPMNLTGWTFIMTVDALEDPPDETTNLFEVSGIIDDDPLTGMVSFTPNSLQTTPVGEYFYDVEMRKASVVRTIAKGKFTIWQDISK
jgi:hypothetical protein